jgi:hypothetical protein
MFASVFSGSRIVLGTVGVRPKCHQPADLISGYLCLSWGSRIASRDADTTGKTLHFVSKA